MSRILKFIAPAVLLMLLVFAIPVSAVNYPDFKTDRKYVNDFAGIISEEAEQRIMSIGSELEDKTTAQVTAVTVNSLEGEDIKDYANKLFEKWGVGQKDKDNGVLILHSLEDREVWIEVGYGLNPILGTIRVSDYFDKDMAPYFKDGDYDTGFIKVYTDIASRIAEDSGTSLGTDSGGTARSDASGGKQTGGSRGFNLAPIFVVLFLAVDGIFFRFRITSMLIKIFFWSSIFRGGGRGGWGGGGRGGGGFGGGSSGGGGGGGRY